MKLSNVLISNLATFPYVENLHDNVGVVFPAQEKGDINIFIGPNGTGKSVFLDIVQQVCSSVLFLPYTADLDRVMVSTESSMQEVVSLKPVRIHNLHANSEGRGRPSFVFLTFTLNEKDRKNLHFVYDNQVYLNTLIAKYSPFPTRFNYKDIGPYIDSYEQITCKVQVDTLSGEAWLLDNNAESIERFILDFFTQFHLLQHCISIHNMIEEDASHYWHALHSTFATIGSYRDLSRFEDSYTLGEGVHDRFLRSFEDANESSIKMMQDHLIGFLYVKKKLAKYLHKERLSSDSIIDTQSILMRSELYKNIQMFCKKYLYRDLIVESIDDEQNTYRFFLKDTKGNEYHLDDLSAGEKSMFGIICAVYGFSLHQGLLIIDEPELHLHPQLQKQFLEFMEEITNRFGLQCIMTTHSPLMINENNIRHVYRFHKDNNITKVVSLGSHYNEDTSKLMQILRFTNTAKIFFVKKIIMVEGETDEYAFGYYLHYLSKQNPERESILRDYEIVNINGKGGYARWKKFLHNFGIESYFIGDRDNIQEISGETIDMHHYARLAERHAQHGFFSKSDKYKGIISYLKRYEPRHWDEIVSTIEELYKKNVFILQHGDIEAYLGLEEKGLEETVRFLQDSFQSWLADKKYDDIRNELETIFKRIFTQEG